MHCTFSHKLSETQNFVYTLLSKVTWHGRAKCLSRVPCVLECMDSCCFVLGVCRASENGDDSVGIKLDDHSLLLTWVLFASVGCLPSSPSYSEGFEPRPSRIQHPTYVPYRDLAGCNSLL
jgi:hypothetical protein